MEHEKRCENHPIIGIVGAGKLGTGLSKYWKHKGLDLAYCYSRNQEHADALSKQTGAKNVQTAKELFEHCDWIWLAISDHAIQSFCNELADCYKSTTGSCDNPLVGKLICHTSGALTSEELNRLADLGGACCSVHPLQAFSLSGVSDESLEKTWFFVEGDLQQKHQRWVSNYFEKTKNPYRYIQKKDKALYHAAACTASNYLVTLLNEATQLLRLCGDEIPFEALVPLINGTIDNFKESGFEALTGPIARGDVTTVAVHLEAMKINNHDSDLYRNMGIETLKAIEESHSQHAALNKELYSVLNDREN